MQRQINEVELMLLVLPISKTGTLRITVRNTIIG